MTKLTNMRKSVTSVVENTEEVTDTEPMEKVDEKEKKEAVINKIDITVQDSEGNPIKAEITSALIFAILGSKSQSKLAILCGSKRYEIVMSRGSKLKKSINS